MTDEDILKAEEELETKTYHLLDFDSVNVTYNPSDYKSKIVMGNIDIYITEKYNWFHRLMVKLILGIRIKKVKGEDKE